MKLRRLSIANFRGIREMTWVLDAPFACLVGPGDSTKTTILDAVGHVLSSRYNVTFTDADFYDCDTDQSIVIEAVVTGLPDKLIEERSQGKNRSGIDAAGNLSHDPLEDGVVEECLVVRLTVDQTLEPVWEVVRPGDEIGDRITASERAELGFFRIGDYADSHLRWGRGSALTSMTASKTDATYAVVEAQRQARQAVHDLVDTPLHSAATIAQEEAKKLGSAPFADMRPGLDPGFGSGTAALVLHEGRVPLTNYGLGSRRLTSLAIQENALAGQSIVAIDEIEYGLDPHRLVHLVRHLRARTTAGELQVLLTTHSPLAVETLSTTELFVVRSDLGVTTVTPVPASLGETTADTVQGVMRERPSSLLARRVIVGEGATESGLMRQLLWIWDQELEAAKQFNAVTSGVTVTNGGGDSQAPVRAAALARLGYPTLLLLDGDVTTNGAQVAYAAAAGVEVVQWSSGKALEDVIVDALPNDALQKLVDLAVDETSEESVRATVGSRLSATLTDTDVSVWIASHSDSSVRAAIASAAKGRKNSGSDKAESKAWFKREDRGERLGNLVSENLTQVPGSELHANLALIKKFAYGSAPAPAAPKPGGAE